METIVSLIHVYTPSVRTLLCVSGSELTGQQFTSLIMCVCGKIQIQDLLFPSSIPLLHAGYSSSRHPEFCFMSTSKPLFLQVYFAVEFFLKCKYFYNFSNEFYLYIDINVIALMDFLELDAMLITVRWQTVSMEFVRE